MVNRSGQSPRTWGILATRSGTITILLVRRAIWTCIGVCLSLTNCCASLVPRRRLPVIVSTVEPYRTVVEELLKSNVEMATIHSRLVREHGYRGSYSSVKRFVHRLRPKTPDVCLRIETPPGREAQVDFGGVGKIRDRATGKLRQAYCFVMTLSYSRHQYAELVFDQKMQTWIGCHRRAFEFFGGVPEEIVIDNLKAAVLKADLDNPTLSVPYTRLARHYGFLVHPCRVRTPEHKGKVENGVRYVQRSFIAGREFVDIKQANRMLLEWVINEAGVRDHGTTHEAPLKRFAEIESSAMIELPAEPFELARVAQCLLASRNLPPSSSWRCSWMMR